MKPHERISTRVEKFNPSFTLGLRSIALDRKAKGQPVYDFGLGETRGQLPERVRSAGMEAFDEQKTMYAPPAGIEELRAAILKWLGLETQYKVENVIVSNGAKQSLLNAFLGLLNPGDGVLVEPALWVSYMPLLAAASACPIPVATQEGNRFKVTPDDLENALEGRSDIKMLIVNTPCNPTGQLYEGDELQSLLDVCVRREIYMVLDRLYWKCMFDGRTFPEPRLDFTSKPWLVTIDGLSKNWRRTGGIRIGWTVASDDVAGAMANLQSHLNAGPAVPAQWAALAALSDYDTEMVDELQKKRDLLLKEATGMPFVDIWPTQATFYSFWDIRKCFEKRTPDGKTIKSSDDVAEYLIEKAGVITASGSAFRQNGYLRLSFTVDDDEIVAGMKAAAEVLGALR